MFADSKQCWYLRILGSVPIFEVEGAPVVTGPSAPSLYTYPNLSHSDCFLPSTHLHLNKAASSSSVLHGNQEGEHWQYKRESESISLVSFIVPSTTATSVLQEKQLQDSPGQQTPGWSLLGTGGIYRDFFCYHPLILITCKGNFQREISAKF